MSLIFLTFRAMPGITSVLFVSAADTLDLRQFPYSLKVVTVSRLSEVLNELKAEQGLTNPQIVERAKRRGAKLSLGNVSNYMTGKHPENPSRATLVAFALALNVPSSRLVVAAADKGREPFTPDPSSDRLTTPQRAAVNEIIRLLADGNTGRGEGNGSPMNDAEGKPADDGLGAFGHRDRGDLDHETVNDGSGGNVRQLHDWRDWAADASGETEKQRLDREAAEIGEENQDPGGDE